jgi:hypothetical protein
VGAHLLRHEPRAHPCAGSSPSSKAFATPRPIRRPGCARRTPLARFPRGAYVRRRPCSQEACRSADGLESEPFVDSRDGVACVEGGMACSGGLGGAQRCGGHARPITRQRRSGRVLTNITLASVPNAAYAEAARTMPSRSTAASSRKGRRQRAQIVGEHVGRIVARGTREHGGSHCFLKSHAVGRVIGSATPWGVRRRATCNVRGSQKSRRAADDNRAAAGDHRCCPERRLRWRQ